MRDATPPGPLTTCPVIVHLYRLYRLSRPLILYNNDCIGFQHLRLWPLDPVLTA